MIKFSQLDSLRQTLLLDALESLWHDVLNSPQGDWRLSNESEYPRHALLAIIEELIAVINQQEAPCAELEAEQKALALYEILKLMRALLPDIIGEVGRAVACIEAGNTNGAIGSLPTAGQKLDSCAALLKTAFSIHHHQQGGNT